VRLRQSTLRSCVVSWSTRFPDPIILPAGGKLVTLQDAGEYITGLPNQTHDAPPWQNAMHVLIQAAEYDGPEFAIRDAASALSKRDASLPFIRQGSCLAPVEE
jgi:hypothetical protein